jgi:adenosylmethionine-8-amino-7-oxononanoate aminotransferase
MAAMHKEMTPTKALEEDDKTYIWHPFTQMKAYATEKPLVIEKGEGCALIDTEGERYIDGVSSLWVNLHGHRRKEIDEAIVSQLGKIAHSTLLGISNVPAVTLAKRLVEITPPGLTKVFYSDNGSTAVEVAIKIAFQYWQQKGSPSPQKTRFLTLANAYHGDTLGSVSVGGIDLFHELYRPLLFSAHRAPSPYCYRCSLEQTHPSCGLACADEIESILKEHHHEIAAMIIEPAVQGAAGMLVSPQGYLTRVRELTRLYDVLLIADEVAVGFGRTGTLFACEHEGVEPDMMALAKGITGGYLPLAATLVTDEIFGAFLGNAEEGKTLYHGHSYTGNPLGCAAALASLDIFDKDRLLESLKQKILFLEEKLELFLSLPHVGEVRQKGFMVGIELVEDKKTKRPYPVAKRVGHRVILEARRKGAIIRPLGDVIVIMPPLSISFGELGTLLDVVFESIGSVTGNRP